jgi:hypothetical protein
VDTFREEDRVIQPVPEKLESCFLPTRRVVALDTGQSWRQMFVRNFSFPKESVALFKVTGYVLEFFSSSLSPCLF